ncbi:MAG: site-specific DNA-methyltransferase, partial [Lactobacillus sp.]
MQTDNEKYNETVQPNTAFLNELKDKLPEFFTKEGSFDLDKFRNQLKDKNVNELSEGYQLDFIGKDYARRQAGEMPTTVIVPDEKQNKGEGKDSNNLFFTGDNLEVLRHLQNNYQNKIDVIYIDPPYNTGSDGFVYPDSFEYSDEKLKDMFGLDDDQVERLKSIQGKSSHSSWLTFMYPRLFLAKKLLTEHGIIFVSIDDNEQPNLSLLMGNIFGESSYSGTFVWKRTDTPANLSKTIKQSTEYIISYCKNRGNVRFFGKNKKSISNNGLMNQTNSEHELIFPANKVDTNLEDGIYKKGSYGTKNYKITLEKDTEVNEGYFVKPVVLSGKFKWSQSNLNSEISRGTQISIKTKAFSPSYEKKEYDPEVPQSLIDKKVGVDTNENAQNYLN